MSGTGEAGPEGRAWARAAQEWRPLRDASDKRSRPTQPHPTHPHMPRLPPPSPATPVLDLQQVADQGVCCQGLHKAALGPQEGWGASHELGRHVVTQAAAARQGGQGRERGEAGQQ